MVIRTLVSAQTCIPVVCISFVLVFAVVLLSARSTFALATSSSLVDHDGGEYMFSALNGCEGHMDRRSEVAGRSARWRVKR